MRRVYPSHLPSKLHLCLCWYQNLHFLHPPVILCWTPALVPVSYTHLHSELVSALELNRSSFGVYWKCTISLIGTTIWMFLILFVNAHHTVDPLGLIPPILVGAISNVIVGTNLLPDALQTGLILSLIHI